MKTYFKSFACLSLCLVLLLVLIDNQLLCAQSFSASYDFYPYSNLANPNKEPVNGERNFEQDLQIRIATLRIKAGYGLMLAKDKTYLMNDFTFDRFDMDYKNWNEDQAGTKAQPAHIYAVKYNLMLKHNMSQEWSILAFVTPGLASDFRTTVSWDDFTYEAALIFVRQYSPNFSAGIGLAYSNIMGEPFPIPLIALEWNNGKSMKASLILPVSLDLWYRINQNIDIGLVLSGDGNQYHGDPDRYGVNNPQLRYSTFTLGPAAKFKFLPWMSINIDGGYTFLRRFEFYDGDNKARTLDLKNETYVRVNFSIGG